MSDPGATVLICSVNGLLPHYGPYAPTLPSPKAGATRFAILKEAVGKIRQTVFVADHSKMLGTKREEYGEPIFPASPLWRQFIDRNREQISFVVATPPELVLVPEYCSTHPRERLVHGIDGKIDSPTTREYLKTAKEFEEECMGTELDSRFFEVHAVA